MPKSMPDAQTAKPAAITIEVSAGELIDKITILEIKDERIGDAEKLRSVRCELDLLRAVRAREIPESDELSRLEAGLKAANEALWVIEDDIRACEAAKDFGDKFIELARAVYRTNDKRWALKRKIGLLLGSAILEQKAHPEY
jgi:hypothetical protein